MDLYSDDELLHKHRKDAPDSLRKVVDDVHGKVDLSRLTLSDAGVVGTVLEQQDRVALADL